MTREMRRSFIYRVTIVTMLFFSLFSLNVLAQIEHGGNPFALIHETDEGALFSSKQQVLLSLQQQTEKQYFQSREPGFGEALHAGFSVQTNLSPATHGVWQENSDSLRVWQMLIRSDGALALGMILESFRLPETARIFVYNPAMDYIAGSFTHKNNNEHDILSIQLIPGESLVIEYSERKASDQPWQQQFPTFEIRELIYISQGGGLGVTGDTRNLGNAEWCHVDINCPEGDQWQRQKRGVARILMRVGNSFFWCSGSLVNNARQDQTPYFITAAHCGANATFEDYLVWQFYFNLERPECYGTGMPFHNVMHGATFLSEGPLEGGSDFKLLRLLNKPPAAWRPYYNGWNRLDQPASSGVMIHHPGGDAKKISTFTTPVLSATPTVSGQLMAENSTWRVLWTETESGFGVTQGGSSGSPMFNQDGLIVGTLVGGSSNCNSTQSPDFFGKFSYHWDQNGDFFYAQLKGYLDPNNTGITQLPGLDPVVPSHPAPGFAEANPIHTNQVQIRWLKPGQTPNNPGWYAYTNTYAGRNSNGSQRATLFHENAFDFSYPVTVSKVSHVFLDPAGTWNSNTFRFRIYDHSGTTLVYQSPVMEAESLVEMIHELEEPITFYNKFYIAVDPLHGSGHPSSAYQTMNYGNAVSFFGGPHNWQVAGDNSNHYVYLTSIYVDSDLNNKAEDQPAKFLAPKSTGRGNNSIESEKTFDVNVNQTNRWANSVVQYNVFKNNELIHVHEDPAAPILSYIDTSGPGNAISDAYHITAIYPDGVESKASNTAWLFHIDLCDEVENVFPVTVTFTDNTLPNCWTAEPAANGWQTGNQAIVDGQTVEPYAGEYFAYIVPDTNQPETNYWLVSPPLDISGLTKPAVSFWFNADISDDTKRATLAAYISHGNGSFNKLWDATEHPHYTETHSLQWIQTTHDLTAYKGNHIRIAFLVQAKEPGFVGLDNILIRDASDMIFPLSLSVSPNRQGEVYGAGNYIAGQTVNVYAEPNQGYYFYQWQHNGELMGIYQNYRFVMPAEPYALTAVFSTEDHYVSTVDMETDNEGVTVFPNPSTGYVSLHFPNEKMNATIRLMDSRGIIIKERKADYIPANTRKAMNLHHLHQGFYFIIIDDKTGREVIRLTLTR